MEGVDSSDGSTAPHRISGCGLSCDAPWPGPTAGLSNRCQEPLITTITSPTGGSGLPSSGALLDYVTGLATPVTLTVSGGDFTGAVQAAHGADPLAGTDAHSLFDGIVSGQGAISYVNAAGNALVLTLTGLDPSKTYDLTYFAHRDKYVWDRASLVTLSGQAAFTNSSSVATDNANEPGGVLFTGPTDPSTRLPSDNDNGYVVRFSTIDPGSDGVVILTISFDGTAGSEYKGKYGSAVRLQENSGSASVIADTPTIHLAALRHSASTGPSMVHRLDWVPPDSPSTIRVGGGALGLRFGLPQLSAAPADPLVHLVSHGSASSTTISPVGGSVLAGSTVTFSWSYTGGGGSGPDVAYKYTGKELDGSTGLYFYEARYYDASLGRFISADTIVPNPNNPQTLNRYSYVFNNPLRYTDPTGRCPTCSPSGYDILLSSINRFDFGLPDFNAQTAAFTQTSAFNLSVINLSTTSYSATINRYSVQNFDLSTSRFSDSFPSFDYGGNIPFLSSGTNGYYQSSSLIDSNLGVPQYDSRAQQPTTFEDGASLPGPVIDVLSPYLNEAALQTTQLFNGIPAGPRLFRDPDAFTFGNNVYFAPGAYNPNTASGLALIGHEVLHVQQYAKLGTYDFMIQYGTEYLGYRFRGFSDDQAYRLTSFEDVAFTLQGRIKSDLLQQGFPK